MKYLNSFENIKPEKKVEYYDSGNIKSDYLNNIEYDREDWINKLKEINSPHYKEQKMLYDAEKYNL